MLLYNDIRDLPLWNYIRIIEDDEKRYLIAQNDYTTFANADLKDIEEAWDKIISQITDFNGISEDYQDLIQMQKEIVLDKLEIYKTGDLSGIALIRKKEKSLIKHSLNIQKHLFILKQVGDQLNQMKIILVV